jgi:hypothetical protein
MLLAARFDPATIGLFPSSYYHYVAKNRAIKLRSNFICLCAKYFEFKFHLKNLDRENTKIYEISR